MGVTSSYLRLRVRRSGGQKESVDELVKRSLVCTDTHSLGWDKGRRGKLDEAVVVMTASVRQKAVLREVIISEAATRGFLSESEPVPEPESQAFPFAVRNVKNTLTEFWDFENRADVTDSSSSWMAGKTFPNPGLIIFLVDFTEETTESPSELFLKCATEFPKVPYLILFINVDIKSEQVKTFMAFASKKVLPERIFCFALGSFGATMKSEDSIIDKINFVDISVSLRVSGFLG